MAKVSKTSAGRHHVLLRSTSGNVVAPPPPPPSPTRKPSAADGAAPKRKAAIPRGFCFRPTDYELVHFYLAPKVLGETLPLEDVIHELDIYCRDPEDLPIDTECPDWRWAHFFLFRAPEETSRRTPNGFWRPTGGQAEAVKDFNGEIIGFAKSFVFYRIDQSVARRTCWKMDEFRLNQALDRLRNHEDPKMNHLVACEVYASKEDLKRVEKSRMEFSDETDPFAPGTKKSKTESAKKQGGEGEEDQDGGGNNLKPVQN